MTLVGWSAGLIMLGGFVGAVTLGAFAQTDATLVARGVYTAEQAFRGKSIYAVQCAECHGSDLGGTSFGDGTPALKRDDFMAGKTLNEVFETVKRAMPYNKPGTLPDGAYFDVIAFVLSENGYPSGSEELGADRDVLRRAVLPRR